MLTSRVTKGRSSLQWTRAGPFAVVRRVHPRVPNVMRTFGSCAAVDIGKRRRRFCGKNEERTDVDLRRESDVGLLSLGTPSGDLSWRRGGVRHVM